MEIINGQILLKYRARPAYSRSVVYLTHSFDLEGNFKSFAEMDSFEISSVFHEYFHAYIDIIIMEGLASGEETDRFNKIMEDALSYYTETAKGKSIKSGLYRKQSSEEAMAIQVTNLVKYKIVLEKVVEKAARNYIYGKIDLEQLENEIESINREWTAILVGRRSRGYYNKSFLRIKFEHLIDVKNNISQFENSFIRKYILPGIEEKYINRH